MLASDDNNPHFANARNPDDFLSVQFYSKALENEFESAKQKRPIFYDCDMVKIISPGNVLNIVDTSVTEQHKKRFPRQWAQYQLNKNAETHAMGTPLSQWPRLSKSQVLELQSMKFFTVEAIAGASDEQLRGIGMVAGVSVFAFRDDAKRFLAVAEADSKLAEADQKVLEAEQRERDAQAKIQAMQEQLAQSQAENEAKFTKLMAAFDEKLNSAQEEKRGPGRPPKSIE